MTGPAGLSAAVPALADAAGMTPGLRLLVLFGSRGRGEATDRSDWDLGYLGTQDLDVSALLGMLVTRLGTDHVDLVDLERASGLLRYRAARDGHAVFEASAGAADRFRLEAADFWCDAAAVLQRGYEDVLAELEA